MTPEEIKSVLDKHAAWRRGEVSGAGANLAGADLAGADLARANLAYADLARANLADADLAYADLAGADLAGADLAGANLAYANLAGANLAYANLADADLAYADLAGANLAGADLAGANLAYADLAGADLAGANLAGADLAGADRGLLSAPVRDASQARTDFERRRNMTSAERAEDYRARHPEVPYVPHLDAKILAALEAGAVLDMGRWHGIGGHCGTTHCRAGFSTHLAGEAGRKLEEKYGPQRAGAMIYRASTGRVPHFFATTDRALADIKACAAEDPLPVSPEVQS